MLGLLYLILFLALSAAATWWRVTNYQRHFRAIRTRGAPRIGHPH